MNRQTIAIGAGILAGLATAALSAAMSGGMAFLFMLSPLPLMLAALGFGAISGLAAALTTVVVVGAMAGLIGAAVVAAIIVVPSVLAAQLANLARPAEEVGGPAGKLVWFPLADILFYTGLAIAAGFIVTGIIHGYGDAFGTELTARLMEAMQQADPQMQLTSDQMSELAAMMTALLPAQLPFVWMCVLVANLYTALALANRAGQLKRPHDAWPMALRMPRAALPVFAVAMLLTLASGGLGHIGSAVSGAMAAGFMMAGFAMLHERSMGKPWRPAALGAAYLAALFFIPVLLIFAMAGLTDTRRPAGISDAGGPPPLP
ncbi:hypothetical protein CSC94_06280 [Zhengella mangrovi]|uniref:DUF2232 domain-containing protein n=1 Tax=Zhengella mangrovi TaxID=1982044 RepID=A0A2G1QRX7_9HYPH|nr:DUF2232 domain-containing protein [Zhengella mangrovi]PHP68255.1 hypothetical protein CSC94_06280 [Zhengella mangrovi]